MGHNKERLEIWQTYPKRSQCPAGGRHRLEFVGKEPLVFLVAIGLLFVNTFLGLLFTFGAKYFLPKASLNLPPCEALAARGVQYHAPEIVCWYASRSIVIQFIPAGAPRCYPRNVSQARSLHSSEIDIGRIADVESGEMDQSKATLLVVAFLGLLAVFVIVASILILSGGKVYHKIPEKSRPRRWFVAIFFSYFVMFCLWFPVWFFYPHSLISQVLSFIFAAFTAFIGAWYVLGKVGAILLPIVVLIERIIDAYRDRSEARRR